MKKQLIIPLFLLIMINSYGQNNTTYEETIQWIKGIVEQYGDTPDDKVKYLVYDNCTITLLREVNVYNVIQKVSLKDIGAVYINASGGVTIECIYGQKLVYRKFGDTPEDYNSKIGFPIEKNSENIQERLIKALNYARKLCGAKDTTNKF